MKNNKGFSFIELLAVLVILGILMAIAIYSVSVHIDNTKKDAYLAAVHAQVESVKLLINSEEYYVFDETTTYIFSYRMLKQEDNLKSPYGDWVDAYVYVIYKDEKLLYFWTGVDTAGWKIDLEKETKDMNIGDIYNTNSGGAALGIAIDGRENIVVYDLDEAGKEIEKIGDMAYNVKKSEADLCYEYELLENNTYRITGYDISCGTELNIPSAIDGITVSKIGAGAFRNKGITRVNMYYGVKIIEMGAFQNNNITELRLPSSIEKIESYAFYKNQITAVKFPEGLKSIGDYGFATNLIKKVVLPGSLTSIGSHAFYDNQIEELEFHSNPTIGTAAFSKNKMPASQGFIYKYDANKKEMDYTTIIGYCSEPENGILEIPETAGPHNVAPTTIENGAFQGVKSITSVYMPDSITSIGTDSFSYDNIESVHLSAHLQKIGTGAFRVNKLKSIDIPDSVTELGKYPFISNNIKDENGNCRIIYDRTENGIDYSTIVSYGCGNEASSLVIPATAGPNNTKLRLIKAYAFSSSKIKSITLPNLSDTDNLTIENDAFKNNWIKGDAAFIYKIENGIEYRDTLSSYAGLSSGLGDEHVITIPETSKDENNIVVSLTSIQASFTWLTFSKIIVPKTVTSIQSGVFGKGNRNNENFETIINLTGRRFDWYTITSSTFSNPGPFISGTIYHKSGNIEVDVKP